MDLEPIWLSLRLAAITTILLLFIGVPIAYWLSRKQTVLKLIAEALITMPLVLPPSVLGFYLLLAFSPSNAFGEWLQAHFDLQLVFSFKGLVIASIIYSLPFMVSPIKAAFSHLPKSMAEASYIMGKSKTQTFFKVLLPNIKASIFTAVVLTFAHTLGEFGVVLMIGGNIPGQTKVASIAIYDAVETMDYVSANAYALILFAITFIIVVGVFIINRNAVKSPFE
ncbi:molybdate ABC transporter permease subunit [Pedobacter sp. MC2016-05]|uniref:molybdate ABC transporter permease subunit n=1 Tax=Pedobacter sp. MC2016-05 TaxID=2994474 RepID=UPI00224527F3|nr:molybdate ABC transporter permease subunit [Pedobacter sp. MC2016-05]MCX2473418.1 molybdate ABC transporter permease subunit [Pedobacter sp. MC2016-05]